MAYSHARAIVIPASLVAVPGGSDLTNFPLLVSGTFLYLRTTGNGGDVQHASGHDVAFFSDHTLSTQLKHEIEKYVASTGEVVYWVKVPTVSTSANSRIYIAYGDSGVSTSQADAANVWDSNYKRVYHLPDGSTLTANDSTSNAGHGTKVGAVAAAAARINGGASFNGDADYITVPDAADLDPAIVCLELWANLSSLAANGEFFSHGNDTNGWYIEVRSDGSIAFAVNNGAAVAPVATNTTGLHHWMFTHDGANTKFYRDGALVSTIADSRVVSDFAGAAVIGNWTISRDWGITGWLDEVRLSNVDRGAAWAFASYNNQLNPTQFCIFGTDYLVSPGSPGLSIGSQSSLVGEAAIGAPDTAAYSIAAAQATFALSGQTVLLLFGRRVVAAQGSYALNGQPAALSKGTKLAAAAGTYALSGEDAAFARTRVATASAGSFVLSGQVAVLKRGYPLAADVGSLSLNGQPAGLRKQWVVAASNTAFSLTGQASTLRQAHTFAAQQGSFTLTGIAAAFAKTFVVTAANGSFSLDGQSALLTRQRQLLAAQGSHVLSGQGAAFSVAHKIAAAPGTFTLTGFDANLTAGANKVMSAGVGSFTLNGQNAGLIFGHRLPAATGSYSQSGQDAALVAARRIAGSLAIFTLAGEDAQLLHQRSVVGDPGSFALTGYDSALSRTRVLTAETGTYAMSGVPVVFVFVPLSMTASVPGQFVQIVAPVTIATITWTAGATRISGTPAIANISPRQTVAPIVANQTVSAIPAPITITLAT